MSDKDLLEMAAKAAGHEWRWDVPRNAKHGGTFRVKDGDYWPAWNPILENDAALVLAATLKIDLYFDNAGIEALWIDEDVSETHKLREHADLTFENVSKRMSATRRAIVRAAAEIGRAMP